MIDRISELAQKLRAQWPETRVEVETFPSGAAYLDVFSEGRHFLMRYFPASGMFGVDEVLPAEGFLEKYALVSADFDMAANYFRGLVVAALASGNGTSTTPSIQHAAS
jgi:hypothetical protein